MKTAKPLSANIEKRRYVYGEEILSCRSTPVKKKRDESQANYKFRRISMIPVLKTRRAEKPLTKCACSPKKQLYPSYPNSKASLSINKKEDDIMVKLQLLEQKEKSIADYYSKVEKLIKQLKKTKPKEKCKINCNSARKIISEPMVCSHYNKEVNTLSELERRFHQISEIWLKASTDLSCTINDLKNIPPILPEEFETEATKFSIAIKQTKSLTLIKTRNIIAEAKKLFQNRERIRTELESLLNCRNLNVECMRCCCSKETKKTLQEKGTSTGLEISSKKFGGTGDSSKDSDFESQESSTSSSISEGKRIESKTVTCDFTKTNQSTTQEFVSQEEKEDLKKLKSQEKSCTESGNSTEAWERELDKKKKNIKYLNNKIFELQKTCNYHSTLYKQLQAELCQFQEKIHWNEILWKQIGKLKEQVKVLQQSNKQLECQKKELECKIKNLQMELKSDCPFTNTVNTKNDEESDDDMELFPSKKRAIIELKKILDVMRDQENFAQMQINEFQNKIDELEKRNRV